MAKPRGRTVISNDDDDGDDVAQQFETEGQDSEFFQALAELDGASGAIVRVSRIRDGRRPEYVGVLSAADFSLQVLQDRYGGGEYTLTVLDGARRYRKQATVAIAQPLRSPTAAEPSANDKAMQEMREAIVQQGKMIEALMLRGQAPATPAVDPNAMRRQLLEDMTLMRNLVGGGNQAGIGADKLIEVLKTGMEIAKDAAGGEGDMMSVFGKALDVLGQPLAELMRSHTIVPAGGLPPAGQLPAARGAPPGAPPKQQQPPKGGQMNVHDAVGFLIGRAAAGADPGLYADLVIDNVPESMLRHVLAGDVVAQLSQIDPRVAQHAQWFRDLGAMLSEALRPDDAATGSSSPAANGDTGGDPAGS